MRDNTNEVIMKIEGLLPSYIESFADLQAEGLRITRDFFGTCYIAEKEILDKMGVDQKAIETFDRFSKILAKTAVSEIDMMSSFQRTWTENMMASMKSYDDYIKVMLSSYAKVLEYTLALIPKRT
jgi:predicted transcriptional regulator